jgi:polynucleotide 5'-kinase involved in rRNA processing
MSEELVQLFKMSSLSTNEGFPTEHQDDNRRLVMTDVAGDDEKAETINYEDIMTEEFENNDTRIAMIGNVDSGKSTLIGIAEIKIIIS